MERFYRPVPMATRSRASFGQENRAPFAVWQGYVAPAVTLGVSECGLRGSAAVSSVWQRHMGRCAQTKAVGTAPDTSSAGSPGPCALRSDVTN